MNMNLNVNLSDLILIYFNNNNKKSRSRASKRCHWHQSTIDARRARILLFHVFISYFEIFLYGFSLRNIYIYREHDSNNDTKLDGLEMLNAIRHSDIASEIRVDTKNMTDVEAKEANEIELAYYAGKWIVNHFLNWRIITFTYFLKSKHIYI